MTNPKYPQATSKLVSVEFSAQLHVLYRNNHSEISDLYYPGSGAWQFQTLNALSGNAPFTNGNPTTIVSKSGKHMRVYYTSQANELIELSYDIGTGEWAPFVNLSYKIPASVKPAGDPVAVFYHPNPDTDQVHVFYRGADGDIAHFSRSDGDDWNYDTIPFPGGDVAAATFIGTQLHVVYRDRLNRVIDIFWTGQNWSFQNLSAIAANGSNNSKGDLCIMSNHKQLSVFYRNDNNDIGGLIYTEGGGWKYMTVNKYGNSEATPFTTGDPSAVVWTDQQHMAYKGVDNYISDLYMVNESFIPQNLNINAPGSLTPQSQPFPAAYLSLGQCHYFYIDVNGGISDIIYGGGSWSYTNDITSVIPQTSPGGS